MLVTQRPHANGPVSHPHVLALHLLPAQRVLHPLIIQALLVVLAGMTAAALLPGERSRGRLLGASDQIPGLQGLDEVRVPDEGFVFDRQVREDVTAYLLDALEADGQRLQKVMQTATSVCMTFCMLCLI